MRSEANHIDPTAYRSTSMSGVDVLVTLDRTKPRERAQYHADAPSQGYRNRRGLYSETRQAFRLLSLHAVVVVQVLIKQALIGLSHWTARAAVLLFTTCPDGSNNERERPPRIVGTRGITLAILYNCPFPRRFFLAPNCYYTLSLQKPSRLNHPQYHLLRCTASPQKALRSSTRCSSRPQPVGRT